jgi:hypothetical protein
LAYLLGPAQESIFLTWLVSWLGQLQDNVSSLATFSLDFSSTPGKLGRQSCRVTCLLINVSGGIYDLFIGVALLLLLSEVSRFNQCCGSGMFIPDPDFYPSRISDPGSKNSNKSEGWKKIVVIPFFCSHKFHKIVNYFIFEMLKKKICANFQRILELFTQKLSLSSQKYGFGIRDPDRDPEKTYSGSRIQGSKRHRIPHPDPQHWFY